MSEIRLNIATDEWVIIATERARRPEEFIQPARERTDQRPAYDPGCPFCPGNEEPELERLRLPASGPWAVRVVANRYPALQEHGALCEQVDGLHRSLPGVGYHEVLVETPLHNTCAALQPPQELLATLQVFQQRGATMRADQRVVQLIFFKNHGRGAGSSQPHPHAQIVALPVIPHDIRARSEALQRYYHAHGACALCAMREQEEQQQLRMLVSSRHFSAFVPFAAYSPFHLWIVPRRHGASFLQIGAAELQDLATVLHELLARLYRGLGDPDFNYVIRTAPEPGLSAEQAWLHWYVAVIPRVSRSAGFEMGSGMFINTSLPEESARFLRSVVLPR